ncbi:MAG: FAD-binding oxidoreductase [Myxococcales bacterium]
MTPATIEEAQAMLARQRTPLFIRGGGTKVGALPPDASVLHTGALNRIVEYAPSDQVVILEVGVTLAQLQRELAKHGQRLALDAPFASRATLGGIVAANSFGPLRTRYGSVRDLIIGVSIVRADGTRAKGGGKVVKTVAGFDLPKLMCGSRGTLALIATVTFRVHPLPEHALSVVARSLPAQGVVELVRKVRALQLEPAAMLAVRTPQAWDVFLRFEGFRAGVVQQREKLRDLDDAPASVWEEHLEKRPPVGFGALPTQLPQIEAALGGAVSWYPTLGLGFADNAQDAILAAGGWIDSRPAPASLTLHKAVKQRLDPENLLAPGSFVGGI